ncbi:unnamed protein product [Coffea canephora]|uniref:Protein RER1 n=1 Tax=Coffea canephora TaxID=49390 RepID=A0A068TZ25_COFCA|nr:unnamed protein product [Coffea canephora]
MNVGGGGKDGAAGESSSAASSAISKWVFSMSRGYQHMLDKSTPQVLNRWIFLVVIAFIYAVDPEFQELTADDGPSLPTRGSDEFRPFVRRLPEFKFWYSLTKAFCVAFMLTFFSAFDVPVFWPILLFYWLVLFISTMKRQIMHMIKYRYVPFTFGKQRYTGKKVVPSDDASISRP